MNYQKLRVLSITNAPDYLECKCCVYFPHMHDFCMFDSLYKFLETDILEDHEVFEVTIQKCLFEEDKDFVTIWLKE